MSTISVLKEVTRVGKWCSVDDGGSAIGSRFLVMRSQGINSRWISISSSNEANFYDLLKYTNARLNSLSLPWSRIQHRSYSHKRTAWLNLMLILIIMSLLIWHSFFNSSYSLLISVRLSLCGQAGCHSSRKSAMGSLQIHGNESQSWWEH